MFPSGQWSFNPLAYQNVPTDRVDWASLAQQWIKMKETMPSLDQEPTPPPAPLISKLKSTRAESTAEPPPNDIEGGEAPMDMDTKDDEIPESVGASSHWNQWNNWPSQWGWGWSGNAGTVPSADNASSTSSSVDSKVKWSENLFPTDTPKSTSETWSKGNRPRLSQKPVALEQTPIIDAVKKKQLPAWIREGLNKMEREKQKKLERERAMQERLMRKQESFESDSPEKNPPITANDRNYVPDDTSQTTTTIPGIVHSFEPTAIVPDPPCLTSPPRNKEENTSLIRKTKDEIMEESMLKIRRILTEILLEATENHVVMIAREELKRAKLSARAIRRSNVVSSLGGNLGLNIYGSGSDDSDSSSSENTHFDRKSDSDEELKLLIDRKKQDFRKIEDEIEIEIEKQEAKEKSIARQEEDEEDENDDDDENSDVDDNKSNSGLASRLQEVPRSDVRSKPSSSKTEDESNSSSIKSKEYREPYQEPSGSGNDGNQSSGQVNGDRKNGKVELKHTRSPSSSSSSDSESESSSSKSSRSKSSYSSRSGSDSDTSSHRKRSKHKEKTSKRSKRPVETKRYRSRSRSRSRDRRITDSRVYSSRSYKSKPYGRRSSPYRRRSRSRQRSSSRSREKYSESSRRYDSHSKPRRRRSTSSDSRRSRYQRR